MRVSPYTEKFISTPDMSSVQESLFINVLCTQYCYFMILVIGGKMGKLLIIIFKYHHQRGYFEQTEKKQTFI